MDALLLNLLNGISFALILFLIASGFALICGVMGILNLAHGAFYILGVYFGLILLRHGGNFWLAAFAGGGGVALVGLILERLFLRRLYKQENEQVLLTFGFVYIFVNLTVWFWGPFSVMVTPPSIIAGSISVGDLSFPIYRFVLVFIGLVLAAGLWLLVEKTRAGAIVRAGMDDKEMTIGLGVNYGLVSSAVFLLGSFIGGFAGFIGAPVVATNPGMAFDLLLLAFVVIIVGGTKNVQGTLLASILIGLLDYFGKAYFPDFAYFTIYLAMIIVLLVKPSGLLGRLE